MAADGGLCASVLTSWVDRRGSIGEGRKAATKTCKVSGIYTVNLYGFNSA